MIGGLARILAGLAVALALPGGAPASERATVGVSFLQGEQVVVVQRSGSGARAAVTALLAGPTAAERAREITTQVPAGVPVRSVTVANGVSRLRVTCPDPSVLHGILHRIDAYGLELLDVRPIDETPAD